MKDEDATAVPALGGSAGSPLGLLEPQEFSSIEPTLPDVPQPTNATSFDATLLEETPPATSQEDAAHTSNTFNPGETPAPAINESADQAAKSKAPDGKLDAEPILGETPAPVINEPLDQAVKNEAPDSESDAEQILGEGRFHQKLGCSTELSIENDEARSNVGRRCWDLSANTDWKDRPRNLEDLLAAGWVVEKVA